MGGARRSKTGRAASTAMATTFGENFGNTSYLNQDQKDEITAEVESLEHLENVAEAEIYNKIYTREGGGIKETGAPFFIEEIRRKGMVRTNNAHNLRVHQKKESRFKSNCQPMKTNYLHSRMIANNRHYMECVTRRNKYILRAQTA